MFYHGVTVRGSSQIVPVDSRPPIRSAAPATIRAIPAMSRNFVLSLCLFQVRDSAVRSAVSMTFRLFSRTLVIFSPSDGVIFPEPMLSITRWLAATTSYPVLVGPNRICTAGSRRAGVIRSMQAAGKRNEYARYRSYLGSQAANIYDAPPRRGWATIRAC